ncbi:MAG: hypothetical protein V1839_03090 [archaeon]
MNEDVELTSGQVASWYHGKILRIPHGKQYPKKRYLNDKGILELFGGIVVIQEKVDGKQHCDGKLDCWQMREDMTGKHTVHEHVLNYTNLPPNKMIFLDLIAGDSLDNLRVLKEVEGAYSTHDLDYATLYCKNWRIGQIYGILEVLASLKSHFGPEKIEGLVIKNYGKQLFGKWINDEFEDKLRTSDDEWKGHC